LPMLAKILSQRHGFKCTVLFSLNDDGTINPENGKSLGNSEALDSADAIVMLLRFRNWPEADSARFEKVFLSGKPIIALRTSTHAFNGYAKGSPYEKWNFNNKGGFGKEVLGETWVTHWGKHKVEGCSGVIEPSAKNDPILNGVADIFAESDVYEAYPPADAKILVRGVVTDSLKPDSKPVDARKKRASDKEEQGLNEPAMPVVWTRLYKNPAGKTNRILTTTMGAAVDLENEGLRRLVVNGVFWGLDMKVPAKADVAYVDEYKPSFYGFAGHRKGLKVSDFAIGAKVPGEPLPRPGVKAAEPKKESKAAEPQSNKAEDIMKPKPREARPAIAASKLPLEFFKGEKIAFVGNSLAERMNLHGYFETLLHSRFPQMNLQVRNFARPADEVGIRQRPGDYVKLDDPLYAYGPDTFLCFFGFNESFAGPEGVEKFKADYEKFLDGFAKAYPRDDKGGSPRFVLISPVAFEFTADKFMPAGTKENANLKLYTKAVAELAEKRGIAFVDIYNPTDALFNQKPGAQYTLNAMQLTESGDREVAQFLDRELFRSSNPAKVGSPEFEKLRAAVNDKSWVHLQDYRMLNGWYVYGGRRTLDTETFPREYLKIRAMVEVRDRYVWDIAAGKPVPAKPDDSKTGELFVPKTGFGTKPYSEPKELKYLTPEESMATMTLPPGFEVQLVASEREFPQLIKPDQINFDNKGRLWVSCMPTYPQWVPGTPRPSDRLLIFDDFDKNGKARKCTTFYDKLICPTGFEFWNGGVLVVDEPRLIFLKDTDGDDKADVVIDLLDGWATDDTHHTIGAFEYSNGGLLHMLEGVSMYTAVETPWGPIRNASSPGCYVLDPRSLKIRRYTTPGYGNPWCYVFDKWGQGIVGDGTTPQQHWDTPLSTAPYSGRKGLNTIFNGEGMRPNVGNEFLITRQFPDEVQGQFIYACVINMNGLTRFEVRDDGAGYTGNRKKQTVDGKQVPDDLLSSTDKNFRPTDPQIGPDGAVYFGDWHTALLGHMQYSQRDPNRDKTHGRVYRVVYKGKPLLKPVTQFGKSIPEILEQLKEYEPRTRYRARRELGDRPTADVVAAVKKWVTKLDPKDKEFDRLRCEALWVQQWHHAVDPVLLKQVLRAPTGEARAAATRILADEWQYFPNAMELIKPQVNDEFARTRVEAVRALSFIQTKESVETMVQVANHSRDYWMDYTLQMSLGSLENVWKPELKAQTIAMNNPKGLELLHEIDVLAKPEGAAAAALKKLVAGNASKKDIKDGTAIIAKARGNADKGKEVFRRICVACHIVYKEGVDYGPNMNGVGTRLKREDIIESILDPNAKVDAKYQTTNIETKDGEAYTGFLLAETPDSITMKIAGGLDQTYKKSTIQKRETLKQSSMPEGLAGGMSAGEFIDIVEFLSSLKQ
ncbi:MAG TPA: HEAT repeat domain-containing protein, partial [Roseimicrobium sp.]|nr:HEAT repeat domain-containing protein [Roseimicrobium sp.]